MRKLTASALLGLGLASGSPEHPIDPMPLLALEAKIVLGKISGRIDHLGVDLGRQRLFVAELGNNSVGVIDLRERQLVSTIDGLAEPQGVGYVSSTDTLYVANGRDGSVRLFQGPDLVPAGRIELGDDADNIRVDAEASKVFIGHGRGALAIIDPVSRVKIADIPLAAHPEGFQLEPPGSRILVNLPGAREVGVVSLGAGKVSATWPMQDARANFPMAIDEAANRVLVVFRSPAKLAAFAMGDGSLVAKVDSCSDADDVFIDAKRNRVYVSCGDGLIDVFEPRGTGYYWIGHIPTAPGARTSLLVPELDRFFLAARATGSEPASIWVFRPTP